MMSGISSRPVRNAMSTDAVPESGTDSGTHRLEAPPRSEVDFGTDGAVVASPSSSWAPTEASQVPPRGSSTRSWCCRARPASPGG